MINNIFSTHPYTVESAKALAGLLLDGAHETPSQTKVVLASLLVDIVNSRIESRDWSWPELEDAIKSGIDCGEGGGAPGHIYLDAWFDSIHSPGFEVAAAAVDSSAYPRSTAGAIRTAIKTVAVPSIHELFPLLARD
jgi:hypothetical protein